LVIFSAGGDWIALIYMARSVLGTAVKKAMMNLVQISDLTLYNVCSWYNITTRPLKEERELHEIDDTCLYFSVLIFVIFTVPAYHNTV